MSTTRASDSSDRELRLKFMLVSEETGALLRDFWKILEPQLGSVLDGFYAHLGAVPHLAKMVGNDVPRLKSAQRQHWERLFSGRFDDAYMQGVRTIGLTHNRIGLEPRWYIGGYNFVLRRLIGIATKAHKWSPSRTAAVISAVTTAVMVDMDIAISVYQDAMLTERQARQDKVNTAIDSFDQKMALALGTMTQSSQQMQSTASLLTNNTDQANRQASAVAAASEEASTNVQTVAAAAEELSSSISEISRQVAQSTMIATRAMDEAARTNTIVQGLAEAAQSIGDVVKLISDIAGQTNLLALNATIEAARAGEAGKGFAVVASEVKNLANQTAKATEEISAKIGEMQAATDGSVSAIRGIGSTVEEINQISSSIAAAVEQQSAATQEIARNVQQAAAGTTEVSSNIAGITQVATETRSAAENVMQAATGLSQEAQGLKSEVERFFAAVRAA